MSLGEIATANRRLSYWDHISGSWILKWSELKKSTQKDLSIFVDAVHYQICVLHSLACFLLLGGGYTSYHGPIDSNILWVVPSLYATCLGNGSSSSSHQSAAGKVTGF